METLDRRRFFQATGKTLLGMAAGRAVLAPSSARGRERPGRRPPNFVFILIDDMGWRDLGCYGSSFYRTPNIDRFASSGLRFTQAYAACPVCSPTRASIMTGRYPARLHLTDFLKGMRTKENSPILPAKYLDELPLEEVTIAERLKEAGYSTCSIGKWHLGGKPFYPEHQGFDINIGGNERGSPKAYFYPQWGNGPPIVGRDGEYLTDRLTDEALAFIEGHAGRPFFLYLAHYAVHIPLQAKEVLTARYRESADPENPQHNPIYAAMIESVDLGVGRVLDKLEELGIAQDTVVFFFSDNGGLSVKEGPNTPATSNAPLREGKGYLYEGGIREPLIVRWPGVTAAGTVCDTPVSSIDFFPTILEIAGLGQESGRRIDGASLVPLLRGQGALETRALFWHYPHFSNQGGMPGGAVRRGDYKLIRFYEFGALELYNLAEDIGEQHDLARKRPELADELNRLLEDWLVKVGANMPLPNPDYRQP